MGDALAQSDHPLPHFDDAGAVYVLYGFGHARTYLPLIRK